MAKQDLIFSRAYNDQPLTLEQVGRMAPAAFATTQADHLTSRYGQVTTARAIDILGDYGFFPVQAAQVKARTTSTEHANHLIAFAQSQAEQVAGSRGEIILYNSHDGTSSLKLFAGCYRMICSNGIVAGDGFDARMRHTSGTVAGFEELLREIAGSLPDLMGRIDTMQRTTVEREQVIDFVQNAATLRWEMLPEGPQADPLKGCYATSETMQGLISARRYEDRAPDAWTIYNRVQENLIRGGARVRSYSDRNPAGKLRRSRGVSNIKAVVETNRQLWNLGDRALMGADAPQLIAAE